MATRTLVHSEFGGGLVRVEIDINDANWRPSRVRVLNASASPLVAYVSKAGQEVFRAVAPAGQTTSWNISGVQLGWQPDYLDDRDGKWYPDGLDMRDYTVSVQWPGAV